MAFCCQPTRRQFLQWAGLVAATPLLVSLERRQARATGPVAAINLELVTLTETTAILTWFTGDPTQPPDTFGRMVPLPADTEVWLGTTASDLRLVLQQDQPTAYHYAELTGLEPGRPYFFAALSNGVPAVPAGSYNGSPLGSSTLGPGAAAPGSFVTPTPPDGKLLLTIALCNDMHLGETVAGLATSVGGQGIPPGITGPDYPTIMAKALAAEVPERGAHVLIVGGDVSSEAGHDDLTAAKGCLDEFKGVYYVARGNHDRPHYLPADTECLAVPGVDGYRDCFRTVFCTDPLTHEVENTWFSDRIKNLRILGLDTYDKPSPSNGSDNGLIGTEQWDWLTQTLHDDPHTPTLVTGHHPVTVEADLTTVGKPTGFDLDPQQALQLEALYAASPGVFLHHSGHTHRNKRTVGTTATNVVFQEVAAVKEYPGGFHLLRIFEGGYALNFYKFHAPDAQAWSEASRPEYLGATPFYTFGNQSDRNAVIARDFTGVA